MTSLVLKGKLYDGVKYTVLVGIPAVSTAYMGFDAALDAVGGLPHVDEVVKSLAVVALLLGSLTGISKLSYNNSEARYDGTAFVDKLDPSNNPAVMLKASAVHDPGKSLHLRVQETQPDKGGPEPAEPPKEY